MEITASIVIFNSPEKILQMAITSAENSIINKIYVLDNGPDDNQKEFLQRLSKKIVYIQGHGNIGYGAAHNIAIQEVIQRNVKYHLILNPDIEFSEETIKGLVAFMDKQYDVGLVMPKVLYPNGEIQYLCKLLPTLFDLIFRRFIPNVKFAQKLNDKYVLKNSGYDKIINPPCLSGCFMFLRMNTIKENNMFFDERFFMYCEDFDFIRRLHRVGKTIFYPDVSIIHDHAKESYKSKKMLIEHIKSAIKYFNKWGWFFDKERKRMNRQILDEISVINNYAKQID